MALFITSNASLSVVGASEIENADSCAMNYLENKERVNNEVKIKEFYLENYTSAAITTNGDLYSWGYNMGDQVGDGKTDDRFSPVKILDNVKEFIESDCYTTCAAITKNNDLYCWGNNESGQVGNGTTEVQLTPLKILENVKKCSIDFYKCAAITTNGDFYNWGNNGNGQVGNGSTGIQLTPIKNLKIIIMILSKRVWEFHS